MQQDEFGDVRNAPELKSYGSLAGEATMEFDKVSESYSADGMGVDFRAHCQQCGVPSRIQVTWDEFIMGMNKHIPVDPATRQQWIPNPQRGGFMPPVVCQSCHAPVQIVITPQECGRHLRNGRDANRVSEGYIRQRSAQLAQALQGYQR